MRPSLALVLVSVLVAVWLTVDLVLDGPMAHFDEFVSDRVGAWRVRESPVGYAVSWTITQIGGQRALILVVMTVLVGYLCWTRRTLQPLARTLLGLALLTVTIYAFKYGLGRTAPEYPGSFLHRDGQSYPSGHTANAVLMWGLATWLAVYYGLPTWIQGVFAGLFVISPIASALTMLLLNFHWVTDLITGASMGLILLWVVHLTFDGPLGTWTGFQGTGTRRGQPRNSVAA